MKSVSALAIAASLAAAALAAAGPALAADKIVKIGVLNDMSGVYSDTAGVNSVLAAQMAIEDSGLAAKGWTITVQSGDHQNKPDIGVNVTRQWFDVDGLDVVADVPNSGVALAIAAVTREKNRIFLVSGAASSELTGKSCSPNTVHWTYDTYALAHGTGTALTKAGGDSWFFVTADYAFGKQLEKDTTEVVVANGGKVVGGVRAPLSTADFSSFLLQAQASKAKVIGLANAGADTANSVKQAHEFGITAGGQKLAALLTFITDVHAIGLDIAQGLNLTDTFYWDMNDSTRAWTARYQPRTKNKAAPTMDQAGVYSSVLHYLKTLDAIGSNPHDGAVVVAKMKELPTDDPLFGKGSVRVDGRGMHPAFLWQVKTPAESKAPWDYYKLVATIPAEAAARPLAESECPLVKKTN